MSSYQLDNTCCIFGSEQLLAQGTCEPFEVHPLSPAMEFAAALRCTQVSGRSISLQADFEPRDHSLSRSHALTDAAITIQAGTDLRRQRFPVVRT